MDCRCLELGAGANHPCPKTGADRATPKASSHSFMRQILLLPSHRDRPASIGSWEGICAQNLVLTLPPRRIGFANPVPGKPVACHIGGGVEPFTAPPIPPDPPDRNQLPRLTPSSTCGSIGPTQFAFAP